ncbi:hypothetical protein ACFCX4_28875 [Kitasatospora sp. NPDC056327]|uniref:hypothetical protein n=1 Tax=Kitasatospora sp. NPDC056327 TaxID=3345785 RepID=UPI0035D5C2F5
MTSTASHSTDPSHGRPVRGGAAGSRAAAAGTGALGDGRLPVGPTPASDGSHGADGAGGPLLPAGPWSVRSVRPGRGRRGRAALEVYEHGELVDVLVAARLGRGLLRGARVWSGPAAGAGARRRPRYGLAWGRLPHGGAVPSVGFTDGRLLRLPGRSGPVVTAGEVVTVAGEFWLAWAEGVFDGVLVEAADGTGAERCPLVRVRARTGGARAGGAR